MTEKKKIEDHPQYNNLKMQWDNDKKIRTEFFDFETWFYFKAEFDGVKMRSIGGN